MTSPASLTGSLLRTYNTIFQHPVSHNLEWRHVRALLATLGEIEEEPNGNLRATRHGQTLVLHPSRTKDVAETDELMALRHFLEQSESAPPESKGGETHWLVVIDHHEARIFRSEMHGAIPQQILPHEPDDFFRHAHNSRDFRAAGKTGPEQFLRTAGQGVARPGQILVFGTGTGTSSEMEQFNRVVETPPSGAGEANHRGTDGG